MILVFDLDDTLYSEITYVESGFRAVAGHLHSTYALNGEDSYHAMMETLKSGGRGKIFDRVLQKYGLYTQKNLRRCIAEYRAHMPGISMDGEVHKCLQRFAGVNKYIVTDGNKMVQAKKVEALKVAPYIEKAFITSRYGLMHAKPSPYCFQRISEMENVPMSEMICVGDNPHKDFVGIKPLGCKTIRINRGMYKDFFLNADYEADVTVGNICEITHELIRRIRG
jgi:putative hydrolase of the HAD superfamily